MISRETHQVMPERQLRRIPDNVLTLAVALLFLYAIAMRLYKMGSPQALDYDEGVYWQSLKLLQSGAHLYRDIYYSQPPLFLTMTYPVYLMFGQTIFAARLASGLFSLLGCTGAYLLGRSIAGRFGALMALALVVADVHYLRMSQTLQAEASTVGYSFLSVGVAFVAFKQPSHTRRSILFALSGVLLAVGFLSKLLAAASAAPIALLLAMAVADAWSEPIAMQQAMRAVMGFTLGFLVTVVISLAPYLNDFGSLRSQVIGLHLSAAEQYRAIQSSNISQIFAALASPVGLAALIGTALAFFRRDRMVIPLLAWLAAAVAMLWTLVPLYSHHTVVLILPLVGLSVLALPSFSLTPPAIAGTARTVAIVAMAYALISGSVHEVTYFGNAFTNSLGASLAMDERTVSEISAGTRPGDLVATDAQFLTALAGRDTPPWLVDTSLVRINSGLLAADEAVASSSDPDVRAVLFYSHRLDRIRGYRSWVSAHFRLVESMGDGRELWVRKS